MKYPQDFIDRVREATNLVDLIGQYVQLRRSGGNHQGLCPFHNEKSPSFSVSEDKQVYHCFGCKASGNVFSFVQNYQGLTFPETIEYLARRAGLPIPEIKNEERHSGARDAKDILHRVNALAAQFFHQRLKNLPSDHPAKEYLKTRGLDDALVDTYKLGYAPDDWNELERFFAAKKVPVNAAEQLGLLKRRTGGKSGHYDLFRHRLMFPIFSPTGQCLGFGGRVLSKDQQPKYLNSPDSMVFHKGKVFYGLDTSAKYIRSQDEVIVVEGYMDWLALAKAGIQNCVATLGTALTHDHARVIKRYTQKVLLLFDGDEAGKAAARRSLPILLSEDLLVRGLFLPDGLDPDDFLKSKGPEALRQLLSTAPDLFDLVSTEIWLAAKSSPTGKIQLLDEIAPILAAIKDPRLKTLYSQNLALLADVDTNLIKQSVTKVTPSVTSGTPYASHVKQTVPATGTDKIDLGRIPRLELELLNVILLKEVYLKEALDAGIGDQLMHEGAKATFKRIEEVYRLMPNKFATLSALLAGEVHPADAITRHLTEPFISLNDEGAAKLLQDCIRRVKENFLRSKSKELVSGLRGTAYSPDQLEQIMNIHRNRRSLNRDSQ